MRRIIITYAVLFVAFAFVFTTSQNASYQPQYKIDGQVLDKNNNPLPGVLIRVYRGNSKISNDIRTDSKGNYSVSFNAGEPISTVRYDLTNWNPSTVNNISGVRDHSIKKVLVATGTTLSMAEREELGMVLARIAELDKAEGGTTETFLKQYGNVLASIVGTNIDQDNYHSKYNSFQGWKGWEKMRRRESVLAANDIDPDMFLMKQVNLINSRVESKGSGAITVSFGVKEFVNVYSTVSEYALHLYVSAIKNATEPGTDYQQTISQTYTGLPDVKKVMIHTGKQLTVLEIPQKQ